MSHLLEVKNLKKYFPIKGGFFRRTIGHLKAVDDVSFSIPRGHTFGLVGESGCGKSTLGRAILRLHEPTGGNIQLDGTDISKLNARELVAHRRDMQIIFQDPYASLSPRRTVMQTLLEPLETHGIGDPASRKEKVLDLLDIVGMRPNALHRYPHEFSGGQRQRIGIARALTLDPKFIVADEAVSALDVSVQSQVLNLIARLQRELGISFLFISHDLAVVQHISHEIGVMYLGKLVEIASSSDLYREPRHPYTKALLSAIPMPDPDARADRMILQGDVPSPLNPPSGCPFRTRCPEAMDVCAQSMPELKNTREGNGIPHQVACHLY
jgi:peptide/nickel transport system ATP-binding protein/oligopeptide transport system ATP-binding protein